MVYSRVFALFAALAAVSGVACGPDRTTLVSPSATASLVGTEWVLVELGGQPAGPGTTNTSPTMILDADGTRAAGFAGCNRFTTSYTLAAQRLRFGLFASTRMFCATTMDLEDRFFAALDATRGYRLAGSHLDLLGDNGVTASFTSR